MCEPVDIFDLAKFTLDYCNEKNIELTNLHLQKVLYFLQGRFLRDFGYPLFADDIQAWNSGPVVPSVFERYCSESAFSTTAGNRCDLPLTSQELAAVRDEIDKISDIPLWSLCKEIKKIDSPWSSAFSVGRKRTIEKEKIRNFLMV